MWPRKSINSGKKREQGAAKLARKITWHQALKQIQVVSKNIFHTENKLWMLRKTKGTDVLKENNRLMKEYPSISIKHWGSSTSSRYQSPFPSHWWRQGRTTQEVFWLALCIVALVTSYFTGY